jgi:2-methylcitrate dehydratase PrpD
VSPTAAAGAAAGLARFAAGASPPAAARARAAAAVLDTVGVTLAGALEPASRIVQRIAAAASGGPCTILGTAASAGAADAALANGTAAHALDFDDMCFVSLAHPSAPLVSALLAAGEATGASGRALLDAYVVGFEIEARLGRVMNPRHYQRGWHCTSTLGALGAAAAVGRLAGLDAEAATHALAIAASSASGLKENFGTMVKPLHAGLAARDGVLAASLAGAGMTASALALDGPQGYLRAMDSERDAIGSAADDLGRRWEILDTGITVKLYPSCAATHPALDALLDLCLREQLAPDRVDRIEIDVDPITPTVLIHDRPASGLEAKFSMPFCAAAAMVRGGVDIDTFDAGLADARVRAFMPRVTMRVDPALGVAAPPLTEARVRVHLAGGGTLAAAARGARGYPERPASAEQYDRKFLSCAARAIPDAAAAEALALLRGLDDLADIRRLTGVLRAAR